MKEKESTRREENRQNEEREKKEKKHKRETKGTRREGEGFKRACANEHEEIHEDGKRKGGEIPTPTRRQGLCLFFTP